MYKYIILGITREIHGRVIRMGTYSLTHSISMYCKCQVLWYNLYGDEGRRRSTNVDECRRMSNTQANSGNQAIIDRGEFLNVATRQQMNISWNFQQMPGKFNFYRSRLNSKGSRVTYRGIEMMITLKLIKIGFWKFRGSMIIEQNRCDRNSTVECRLVMELSSFLSSAKLLSALYYSDAS